MMKKCPNCGKGENWTICYVCLCEVCEFCGERYEGYLLHDDCILEWEDEYKVIYEIMIKKEDKKGGFEI